MLWFSLMFKHVNVMLFHHFHQFNKNVYCWKQLFNKLFNNLIKMLLNFIEIFYIL